jgi:hypothetical protein
LSRPLAEILPDLDKTLRTIEGAPLLEKHKPALVALKLQRDAIAALSVEISVLRGLLARRPAGEVL